MGTKKYSFLRIAAALFIVIALSLTAALPALALDLNPADYFQLTFDAAAFSKSAAAAGETFSAVIKGSAICTQDLPLPISEVSITSQVIARPAAGGADLVLNPQYVINIKPLPNKAGQTFDINQTVTMQFPAGTAPGNYTVIGQVAKATVKVIVSLDVTGSFPKEQILGAVKCSAAGTATSPASAVPVVTLPSTPQPTVTLVPKATTAASASAATPVNTLLLIAVIVIGLVAVALAIVVIVLVRRRSGI
jgi:hypothetical protein